MRFSNKESERFPLQGWNVLRPREKEKEAAGDEQRRECFQHSAALKAVERFVYLFFILT